MEFFLLKMSPSNHLKEISELDGLTYLSFILNNFGPQR